MTDDTDNKYERRDKVLDELARFVDGSASIDAILQA